MATYEQGKNTILTKNQSLGWAREREAPFRPRCGPNIRLSKSALQVSPHHAGPTRRASQSSCWPIASEPVALNVRSGEGFRAPALFDGGSGPGAGARKPATKITSRALVSLRLGHWVRGRRDNRGVRDDV